MKYILVSLLLGSTVFAGNTTHTELLQKLQHAVELTASGRNQEGVSEIYSEAPKSMSPKDRAARIAKTVGTLDEIRQLGGSRRVNRISLAFLGDTYCRARLIDRRDSGAVLWTFICESDGDEWVVTNSTLAANSEIGELLKDLDASDYTRDDPKQP